MLLSLSIQNFKSIENMKIDPKELNILIGPNNAGKTSLIHSLALLKQSVNEWDLNGHLVRLGNFGDVVYSHDLRKHIQISLWLSMSRRDRSSVKTLKQMQSMAAFKLGRIHCSFKISSGEPLARQVTLKDAVGKIIVQITGRYLVEKSTALKNINFTNEGLIPKTAGGDSNTCEAYRILEQFLSNELDNFLYYIASRRGFDRRHEPLDARYQKRPVDVGLYGENTIRLLAFIRDDKNYREVNEKITQWLKKFGLEKAVAQLEEGPAYSLRVENSTNRIQSNILDVGFGVNQLLPVIVQCFYAPKGSIIMIEQPEAHLHPRSQADVADFLIDVIDFGNRVIVETHSEHLLLRLQRRVAEKKVESGKINILYISQTAKGKTEKLDMKMDKNGFFLEPIPKGFFEEGFQEALAHLRASHSGSAESGPSD